MREALDACNEIILDKRRMRLVERAPQFGEYFIDGIARHRRQALAIAQVVCKCHHL